ncbi:hypothetical protein AB3R30_26815, partial [Leptolyngbyaceae cyanobacterium UHCC 1019]
CRSLNLEIRTSIDDKHFASLHCLDCDRFIRNLTQPQAQSFGRHLPKPQQQPPQQLSLLEGGQS